MNDQLPDRTILLIILATLLLIFFLVFSFKSEKIEQQKKVPHFYWIANNGD